KNDSDARGGRVRPQNMPTSLLGKIVTPIHGLAFFIHPFSYIIALSLNKFHQPQWILNMALPDDIAQPAWKTSLRLLACAATLGMTSIVHRTFDHLGEQWHAIGVRPYAIVRHPMYSLLLILELFFTVMFWSYVPFVALAITVGAFAINIPIEENIIQMDDAVRNEYKVYKKKVLARVIPFIW
ncbi:hypothetical protein F5I97DRAFT_1810960, partial [Phlebopus sp. FC_14]